MRRINTDTVTIMKKALYIILITAIIVFSGLMLIGCEPKEPTSYEQDITVPESQVDSDLPGEIVEKRGQTTNITEMRELVTRLSKVEDFKFTYSDTKLNNEYRYFVSGRFIKVELGELRQHSTGEKYDEVLMDRISKQAFTHCNKETCDDDKELERTEYEDYYAPDPFETISKVTKTEYINEELLGNDYTKVFTGMYEGEKTTVWVQEYWGYPLKLEMESGRVIEYVDVMVDNTRYAETQTPFNFTIKGEEKHWWSWEHFLKIGQYDNRPDANLGEMPLEVRA